MGTLEQIQKENPRIWLKAFWGFSPEDEGYLGFTRNGDQKFFIENARPGDFVLIYGAVNEETENEDRRQVLGFLEVGLEPIKDTDRMSDNSKKNKIKRGWQNRWTHALPVKRAWRIENARRNEVKYIAPETYTKANRRLITTRGVLLTDKEVLTALQLPVTQVNVFGEEPIESTHNAKPIEAQIVLDLLPKTEAVGSRVFPLCSAAG